MANPNFPSDGQAERIDALVDASAGVYMKLAVGSKAVSGATSSAAWHGAATHADGATAAASDGVSVIAGQSGTTVKHILVDASGNQLVAGALAAGSAASGENPVLVAGSDGTNVRNILTDSSGRVVTAPQTTGATLMASAAHTTTQTSADQTNPGWARGVRVTLDMTVVGTGSVTLTVNYKDTASGKYILLLSGAAVTTNSTNRYTVYPGLTAAANVTATDVAGAVVQVVVTANNANSATYSVGLEWLA